MLEQQQLRLENYDISKLISVASANAQLFADSSVWEMAPAESRPMLAAGRSRCGFVRGLRGRLVTQSTHVSSTLVRSKTCSGLS